MKKNQYRHLDRVERKEIGLLLAKGYGLRDIASALNRSPNTISRELRKNSTKGVYDPSKAQHKVYVARKYSKYQGMKIVGNPTLRSYIEEKTKIGWSPELISGRIKTIEKHLTDISAKGIYKFVRSIYGRPLQWYLVNKGRKRKQTHRVKVTQLQNRIFVEQRPKIIDKRRRFGDWEGDFIVSGKTGQGVLLVLYERRSRYTLIRRLLVQKIELVHQVLYQLTGGFIINSLTLDNDIVFKRHQELSRLIGAPIYFCRPYHSWQKGGVENTNRLIRRYIPKGSNVSSYSDEYIAIVQAKLNERPRKCLNYKTPHEVMKENHQLREELKFTLNDILKVEQNKSPRVSYLRG